VPLYEYKCRKCGHRFEKIERVAGPHRKKCPECGGRVERLAAAPAIQFKGSGWYITDYARKGSSAGESKDGDSAKSDKSAKESKDAAPAKETKETKEIKKAQKEK